MPKPTSTHDTRRRSGRDNPTGRTQLEHDPARAEVDLVPGDPPVPINVWRVPAGHGGMSPQMAQLMLDELTKPGQAVHDATRDPVLADMVTATGRRMASAAGRTEEPEPAALVVCGWPPDPRGLDQVIVLGTLRARLADDGVLVVLGDHSSFDLGAAVRAATTARLTYRQHILGVYAPTDGDRLDTTELPPPWVGADGRLHQSVHTDILLLGQPQHG